MTRLWLLWDSSVGKKVIMAVTGLIMVAYLITHVRSQPSGVSGANQNQCVQRVPPRHRRRALGWPA